MAEAEFDWSELPVDPQDPQSAGKKLLGYVESRLRSGVTEDTIRDQLLAAHLPQEYVTELILIARQGQRERAVPAAPPLRSGPADHGGIFNYLADTDRARRQRREDRKERQKKSARLANSEPDPTFSLEGTGSYAQVLVGEAKRARKTWWVGTIVLGFAVLPVVFFCLLAFLLELLK